MNATRRAFLGGGVAASFWAWRTSGWAQPQSAANPLALTAAEASRQIAPLPAPATPLAAYNGQSPGPLLRIRVGETLALRLTNGLAQPTTLAFPGLRLPNALAGIGDLTQPALAPGASAEIRIAPPDAGFNIYMPHAGAASAAQIARGLYGPIVVEERAPPRVDLEAIVLLSDWRLTAAGEVADLGDARLERGAGRIGALLTAGGAPAPLTLSAAPGARVRLRLANAATQRAMTIAIDGGKTLIVAIDGQPSEPFEPLRNLVPIAPGARFELMFDTPREAAGKVRFVVKGGAGGADEPDRPVVVIEAAGEPVAPAPAISGLPENPGLPKEIALERAQRFDFALSGGGDAPFALNGASFAGWSVKPAFTAPRGAPVTLGLINRTAYPQTMRLGGHVARLLHALDDGWEPYWRDIFLIPPGKTVHAAFIADNPGKWPIESASPERRNAGLAAWFQVG